MDQEEITVEKSKMLLVKCVHHQNILHVLNRNLEIDSFKYIYKRKSHV